MVPNAKKSSTLTEKDKLVSKLNNFDYIVTLAMPDSNESSVINPIPDQLTNKVILSCFF